MDHECASDEKIAVDVSQYGLSVMLVSESEDGPKFGYSIGLSHSYNHPEIIVFGLNHEVAGVIINTIGRRIEDGERFEPGKKYEELLDGYSCVFREVPTGCYPEYFGYARQFYKGWNFAVLQLVWPDKDHRYPWDTDFAPHWIWQQPLLENWPDEKKRSNWFFAEARNLGVFTTSKVLYEHHPILYVTHDEDGSWQFLCGTTNNADDLKLVCLKDIVELDRSVNGVADLPIGCTAWRDAGGEVWQIEGSLEDDVKE